MESWTANFTVTRVDMVRLYFDWNENASQKGEEKGYTYQVTVRSMGNSPNVPRTGFCDISLNCHGKKTDSFTMRASYYYLFQPVDGSSAAISMEDAEREISKTVIWIQFREMATTILRQANIKEVIPFSPSTIAYTKIV